MNDFVLITRWVIPAPIDTVWEAIRDVEQWPQWWRYVSQVTELKAGDGYGVGAMRRFVWGTRLPYRVVFVMRTTRVMRPVLLEGEADGDLNGVGRWELQSVDDQTLVRYEWRVHPGRSWMKLLTPVLHPVFVWNHNGVMRAGEEGLVRYLMSRRRAR